MNGITTGILVANFVVSTAALVLSGMAFFGLVKGKKQIEAQLVAAQAKANRVTMQAKNFLANVTEELAK